MTDNIKLPPMPEKYYLVGGEVKTLDFEQVQDYAREAVRLNAQAVPDAQEKALLQTIHERDAAEDYIDALLDEVLGTDRPEWSSAYGHADAMEQVRETMGALMKPYVDKAWDRFQSALAAPAAPQPAQPLTDEQCDAIYMALDNWAREFDEYEFGLPHSCGGGVEGGREIIRNAISGVKND